MSIGKKIKQLRENKGLSQKELADSLGVTQQAIDAWERSITNPRKKSIDKLSSFFNVNGGFFFEDDIQNKTPSNCYNYYFFIFMTFIYAYFISFFTSF